MNYRVDIPNLAETIAKTRVEKKHAALLAAIHQFEVLRSAKLATFRNGAWLAKRKVLTAAGELVHANHEEWLKAECERDHGDASATLRRLKSLDYQLTECELTSLFIVQEDGDPADAFTQLIVYVEDEYVDRRAFSAFGDGWWRVPRDVRDLCQATQDGERFAGASRRRNRESSYRLVSGIDFAAFMREASAVNMAREAALRARMLLVTDANGRTHHLSAGELDPEGSRYAWSGQRMLDDWSYSSAGRSGARVCDHWVFEISDYTDAGGTRSLSFVPAWTFGRKLAEIKRAPKSDYELYGKLEAMDLRLGVPFGWYFYMLHGNRVPRWAGRRVLRAAEAGKIVLPERDYQVLKSWYERPYGF